MAAGYTIRPQREGVPIPAPAPAVAAVVLRGVQASETKQSLLGPARQPLNSDENPEQYRGAKRRGSGSGRVRWQ